MRTQVLSPMLPVSSGTAVDPVCGMAVDRATAKHVHSHDGENFFFCNPRCLQRFKDDPHRYIDKGKVDSLPPTPLPAAGGASAHDDVEYTCPMHPDVVQMGPGTCPKCGMALEPNELAV